MPYLYSKSLISSFYFDYETRRSHPVCQSIHFIPIIINDFLINSFTDFWITQSLNNSFHFKSYQLQILPFYCYLSLYSAYSKMSLISNTFEPTLATLETKYVFVV